uniref:Uncharacterized protein n=1 Tax=Myotis myotis TaxID=51298 RepID=A0A7J7Z4Z8_MYOMY|nr:hypothetical protein mMyoMyo1_010520 [Myotis myotis]
MLNSASVICFFASQVPHSKPWDVINTFVIFAYISLVLPPSYGYEVWECPLIVPDCNKCDSLIRLLEASFCDSRGTLQQPKIRNQCSVEHPQSRQQGEEHHVAGTPTLSKPTTETTCKPALWKQWKVGGFEGLFIMEQSLVITFFSPFYR